MRIKLAIFIDKCGKTPRLAIEVDGMAFHKKGTRQSERDKLKDTILEKYDLPLIRFKTNESNERSRLVSKLNEMKSSPDCATEQAVNYSLRM